MNFLNFIIILIISIGTALADYCMKLAGSTKELNITYFTVGLVLYVLAAPAWYFVMKYAKLSSIGVIYGVTTVVVLALLGIFRFHEKVSPLEIAAICMGTFSIVILAPRFS